MQFTLLKSKQKWQLCPNATMQTRIQKSVIDLWWYIVGFEMVLEKKQREKCAKLKGFSLEISIESFSLTPSSASYQNYSHNSIEIVIKM